MVIGDGNRATSGFAGEPEGQREGCWPAPWFKHNVFRATSFRWIRSRTFEVEACGRRELLGQLHVDPANYVPRPQPLAVPLRITVGCMLPSWRIPQEGSGATAAGRNCSFRAR